MYCTILVRLTCVEKLLLAHADFVPVLRPSRGCRPRKLQASRFPAAGEEALWVSGLGSWGGGPRRIRVSEAVRWKLSLDADLTQLRL